MGVEAAIGVIVLNTDCTSQTEGPVKLLRAMRPRSPAVLIPAVKGLICGAIGGLALAYAFTATERHVPLAGLMAGDYMITVTSAERPTP